MTRYQKLLCRVEPVALTVDVSRMSADDAFFAEMEPAMRKAFAAMDALEKGAIANPDEKRMVGHYWLRAPHLAPTPEIAKEIETTLSSITAFAADVHSGTVKPPTRPKFTHLILSVGIGGSALGPEFVADALGSPTARTRCAIHFVDNTDPDGIARVAGQPIGDRLGRDADHRLHQERRHARDPQRHARRHGRRLQAAPAWTWHQARRRHDACSAPRWTASP